MLTMISKLLCITFQKVLVRVHYSNIWNYISLLIRVADNRCDSKQLTTDFTARAVSLKLKPHFSEIALLLFPICHHALVLCVFLVFSVHNCYIYFYLFFVPIPPSGLLKGELILHIKICLRVSGSITAWTVWRLLWLQRQQHEKKSGGVELGRSGFTRPLRRATLGYISR